LRMPLQLIRSENLSPRLKKYFRCFFCAARRMM
jgi:hypothetical protein